MALIKRGKTYYLRLKIGGTRHFRSTGATDLRVAKARANEIETELRGGKGAKACPTLEKWWVRYSASCSAAKGPGGRKQDKRIIPAAVSILGPKRRLSDITPADLHQWKQERQKRYSANTVRTEQGVLSAFFTAAVREGFIPSNPLRAVRRSSPISRTRVLSWPEQQALFRAIRLPHHRVAIGTLLGTGLRIHELLAIRSGDIRPEGLRVLGKGKKARVVPLTSEVRELLALTQSSGPSTKTDAKLFPLTDRAYLEALERACSRSKIPPLTLHDLRRTFGTRCAEKIPMPKLARIMGHSSIQTTAQFYVHLEAAEGLEGLERVRLLGEQAEVLPFPEAKGSQSR